MSVKYGFRRTWKAQYYTPKYSDKGISGISWQFQDRRKEKEGEKGKRKKRGFAFKVLILETPRERNSKTFSLSLSPSFSFVAKNYEGVLPLFLHIPFECASTRMAIIIIIIIHRQAGGPFPGKASVIHFVSIGNNNKSSPPPRDSCLAIKYLPFGTPAAPRFPGLLCIRWKSAIIIIIIMIVKRQLHVEGAKTEEELLNEIIIGIVPVEACYFALECANCTILNSWDAESAAGEAENRKGKWAKS